MCETKGELVIIYGMGLLPTAYGAITLQIMPREGDHQPTASTIMLHFSLERCTYPLIRNNRRIIRHVHPPFILENHMNSCVSFRVLHMNYSNDASPLFANFCRSSALICSCVVYTLLQRQHPKKLKNTALNGMFSVVGSYSKSIEAKVYSL